MVGPGRLELPTPRLSSVCSNQLSYGPDFLTHARSDLAVGAAWARRKSADDLSVCIVAKQDDHTGYPYRPEAVAGRPAPPRSTARRAVQSVERKQWFDILMKKEKRGRRSMAIPLCVYKGEPRFGI
jgi:hypothetical protein